MAFIYAGNDLLSHTLSRAVQSALRGLTSVFGMGTGGSPAVRSPTSLAAFSYWLLAFSFAAPIEEHCAQLSFLGRDALQTCRLPGSQLVSTGSTGLSSELRANS